MNDQRQVIFGQRKNIIKNKDISETLNSFLEENISQLEKIKIDYQKSNDDKLYLASIKSLIGNLMIDKDLIELSKSILLFFEPSST